MAAWSVNRRAPPAFTCSPKKLYAFVTVSTVEATGRGEFKVLQSRWGWKRLSWKHREDLIHNEWREEVNHQCKKGSICKHNSNKFQPWPYFTVILHNSDRVRPKPCRLCCCSPACQYSWIRAIIGSLLILCCVYCMIVTLSVIIICPEIYTADSHWKLNYTLLSGEKVTRLSTKQANRLMK